MQQNRISATLSQEDRDAIAAAIETLKEKLHILIDLSPEDRKRLSKMGDKSRAFVEKGVHLANTVPGFLPANFDIEELNRDMALFTYLEPLELEFTRFSARIGDTRLAAGSDLFDASLGIYRYAKAAGEEGGMDDMVDEMGSRFEGQRKKKPAEGEGTKPPEGAQPK